MISEEIIEKVLRNDQLTKSEQSWWMEHKEDKEVQKSLTFLQSMEPSLRIENRKLLKSQLQQFEIQGAQTNSGGSGTRILHIKSWFAIAASLTILAVATTLFFNHQKPDYFDNYYEPYPSIVNPVLKGGEDLDTDLIGKAMTAYQNKNYQESLIYLERNIVNNDTSLFYRANVLLMLERNMEALAIFQNLKNHDNRFIQESAWYEALTMLRLEKTDEATLLLKKIRDDNTHPYTEEAKDLLNKLK